ncbi:hypothetical protein K491DRAFT_721587 [Lophiostoma macrostomum CBS 122681]|uniref:Lysine-specific metallo-endopeptidase domain-containing protein n=1 Tax=Lophiostoma macrostomum CBS 122681 TaxID=1314788 RepID=A0A6A6SNV9_9PLEO|nr:hypothetical protein K491DRAFT_721587 [Lophiostoma macrostomum CBS 122681]
MNGALELIADANDRIRSTYTILEEEFSGDPGILGKLKVEESDPGYSQFFKMDYGEEGGIGIIYDNFRAMRWVSKLPGYEENGSVKRPAGRDGTIAIVCRDQGSCGGADIYAYTSDNSIQDNPTAKHTITFCDKFYDLPRFQTRKLWLQGGQGSYQQRLSNGETEPGGPITELIRTYVGSDALSVLHEFTHITWMGNTNDKLEEIYVWYQCANWATNAVPFGDDTYAQNADSYAWYAECKYSSDPICNHNEITDTIIDGWWVRQLRANGFDSRDPWPNSGPNKKPNNFAT